MSLTPPTIHEDRVRQMIADAVRKEVDELLAAELAKVAKTIEDVARRSAAHIALGVMSHYEVQRDRDRVIISVKVSA